MNYLFQEISAKCAEAKQFSRELELDPTLGMKAMAWTQLSTMSAELIEKFKDSESFAVGKDRVERGSALWKSLRHLSCQLVELVNARRGPGFGTFLSSMELDNNPNDAVIPLMTITESCGAKEFKAGQELIEVTDIHRVVRDSPKAKKVMEGIKR
jgi:hypothetical protein